MAQLGKANKEEVMRQQAAKVNAQPPVTAITSLISPEPAAAAASTPRLGPFPPPAAARAVPAAPAASARAKKVPGPESTPANEATVDAAMENVEEVAATLSPSLPPAPHPAAFKAASLPKGTVAWLRQQGHFIPLTAAHNQEYHVPVPGEPILEVRDKRSKTGDRFALVDRAGY
jgi:hypothetical protein